MQENHTTHKRNELWLVLPF